MVHYVLGADTAEGAPVWFSSPYVMPHDSPVLRQVLAGIRKQIDSKQRVGSYNWCMDLVRVAVENVGATTDVLPPVYFNPVEYWRPRDSNQKAKVMAAPGSQRDYCDFILLVLFVIVFAFAPVSGCIPRFGAFSDELFRMRLDAVD